MVEYSSNNFVDKNKDQTKINILKVIINLLFIIIN